MKALFVACAVCLSSCGGAPPSQIPVAGAAAHRHAPIEPVYDAHSPAPEYVELYLHTEATASDKTRMVVVSATRWNEPLLRYANARNGDWVVEVLDASGAAVCTRRMRSPRSYDEGVPDEVPANAPFVDHGVAFELRCPVPANAQTIRITGPSKTLAKNDPRRVASDDAMVVIGTAPYPSTLLAK